MDKKIASIKHVDLRSISVARFEGISFIFVISLIFVMRTEYVYPCCDHDMCFLSCNTPNLYRRTVGRPQAITE